MTLLEWCKVSDNNLQRFIDIIDNEDAMMYGYADEMEPIFIEVYGERVECECGSLVFPGELCWGCEEWTAPKKEK